VVDEIAGHQVDGAFDSLEPASDGAREGAQDGRLADTHVAFQEYMPTREHGDVDQADHVRLANHGLADFRLDPQRPFPPVLQSLVAGSFFAGHGYPPRIRV